MKPLILIRLSEVGTKGANRPTFERQLCSNVRYALERVGRFAVFRETGRVTARAQDDVVLDQALTELKTVFGVAGLSAALDAPLDLDAITAVAMDWMEKTVIVPPQDGRPITFKFAVRRANKRFPLSSVEIARHLGGCALDRWPFVKVDVHDPRIKVRVEIRDRCAYVYTQPVEGPGGVAVGCAGRVMLMLSGGIDSPVAGWMMMRRGCRIDAVYMHAPPFTSPRSKEKVLRVARVLSRWHMSPVRVHVVPFTRIQESIVQRTDERLRVVLYRRFMTRIAAALAARVGALALVTGDSLGQVASQTLENLSVVSQAVTMPILRPLIATDKNEITRHAERIGTYEHSIQPFPDCCSLFLPRRPKTRAKLGEVCRAEEMLDVAALVAQAVEGAEVHQPSWDELAVHRGGRVAR